MTDEEFFRIKHREYQRRRNGSLPEDKYCLICKAHMPGKKKNAKFCSNRCRQANKNALHPRRVLTVTLP